jgi:hypothetical protein
MDGQAGQQLGSGRGAAAGQAQAFPQWLPFSVPGAGGALVLCQQALAESAGERG